MCGIRGKTRSGIGLLLASIHGNHDAEFWLVAGFTKALGPVANYAHLQVTDRMAGLGVELETSVMGLLVKARYQRRHPEANGCLEPVSATILCSNMKCHGNRKKPKLVLTALSWSLPECQVW